jgi:hypothetical protein
VAPTRNDLFGLAHVGHNVFRWLARAGTEAGQRQRRAHQLQELPPIDGAAKAAGLARKLVLQAPLEIFGLRQLFEAAPILLPAASGEALTNRRQVDPRRRRWSISVGHDLTRRLLVHSSPFHR